MADELSELVRRHGVSKVSFVDDGFLGGDGRGRERALKLVELLKERGLRIRFSIECRLDEADREVLAALQSVGLRHVLIGVESANEADVRLFGKRTTVAQAEAAIALLRGLGLDFSIGFIMFHPLSCLGGVRENLAFLARNRVGAYRLVTNRLEVYPGAPLLRYFQRRGVRFREERYRLYYAFQDAAVGVLYEAFKEVLKPFASVEARLAQARFRAAEGAALPPTLVRLTDETASRLAEAAALCLAAVERGTDPRTDPSIRRQAAAWAGALSASVSRAMQTASSMTTTGGGTPCG